MITIYINGTYFFESSCIIIHYENNTFEKYIIENLKYGDIQIKWNSFNIINFFDIILNNQKIYLYQ